MFVHLSPHQWRPGHAGEILPGAINHSRGVLHGSYKKSLPCGVPQELFCMAKMRYFRGKWFSQCWLYFRCNLRAYGALFCNWKWIKWLGGYFQSKIIFFTDAVDHAPQKKNFYGCFLVLAARFLTFTAAMCWVWFPEGSIPLTVSVFSRGSNFLLQYI
jgi:hypothetical protein